MTDILNWETGTKMGREHAERCIADMAEQQNPNLLLQQVRGIIERGSITAFEVGFFYLLAARLILRH